MDFKALQQATCFWFKSGVLDLDAHLRAFRRIFPGVPLSVRHAEGRLSSWPDDAPRSCQRLKFPPRVQSVTVPCKPRVLNAAEADNRVEHWHILPLKNATRAMLGVSVHLRVRAIVSRYSSVESSRALAASAQASTWEKE